jgi:hypothetical protein
MVYRREDENPPQGNELKAPFGELVLTGRRQWQREQTAAQPLAAVQHRDQVHGAEGGPAVNFFGLVD